KPLDHLRTAKGLEGLHDDPAQRVALRDTLEVRREARVPGEIRLLQHLVAEADPLALVLQAQHHRRAVAGRERAVRVDGGVARARAGRRRGAFKRIVERVARPFGQRLQHRYVDALALAGLATLQQGGEDAAVRVHAGRDVCDRGTGLARLVGRAGDRHETRLALDEKVVRLLVAIRPGVDWVVAVSRDVAHDQRLFGR